MRLPLLVILTWLALPSLGGALPAVDLACPADDARFDCTPIRPGARLVAPYDCTLNFVYRDAEGLTYIGTAGHCTDHVGQRVSARGAPDLGEVVYRRAPGNADFALVRIDPEDVPLVSPRMCGIGGPTGVGPEEVAANTTVHLYGQAYGVREAFPARGRDGILTAWRDDIWKGILPLVPGDSGAPLVLPSTGEALGHMTMLSGGFVIYPMQPPTGWVPNMAGPRLTHAVRLAEEATGLELELVTAPLASPEERLRDIASAPFAC